jgi:hypothetical protein
MRWLVGIALALAVVYACVPADDRPPPGVLTVTVSPSPAMDAGVTTADGWRLSFERVFVAMGNEGFSDSCTAYGEADYDRILDVGNGAGQKLGILHGIGRCDLRFRLGPPSTDVVLGESVTQDDKIAMQTPLPDAYTVSGGGPAGGAGASIDVAGTAVKDGVTKHFHVVYRRRVRYQRCTPNAPPPDASVAELDQSIAFDDAGASVELGEKQETVFDLRIEPEALFRDDLNPTSAALRFDAFAAADVDNDGNVTLDELRGVPIATLHDAGAFEAGTYDVDDAGVLRRGRPIVIESLGDFIYELLLPTLPRFRDVGWCVWTSGRRGPD